MGSLGSSPATLARECQRRAQASRQGVASSEWPGEGARCEGKVLRGWGPWVSGSDTNLSKSSQHDPLRPDRWALICGIPGRETGGPESGFQGSWLPCQSTEEYAEWGVLLGLRPVVSIGSREYPRASFSPETSGLSPFSSLRPPANSNILAPDTCTEGPLATR